MSIISEFYGGYRYFGYWSSPQRFGNQIPVRSKEEVLELISKYDGVFNCGISVSSIKDNVPYLLYLTFDFDSDNLREPWNDAKKLYNFIAESDFDVYINFSGCRGFHVLISTVPKPYTKPQVRIAHKFFADLLKLRTCDKQLFGDVRRLIKIPGTFHAGKFVKTNGTWKRYLDGSISCIIKHSTGDLLDLDDITRDDTYEFEFTNTKSVNKHIHPYPCLEKHIRNEEPPQFIRYSYVAYLKDMGKTPEEIMNILVENHSENKRYEWIDWNYEYTYNQVKHITSEEHDYHPPRCETLKSLGYCIPNCIYSNSDWKLKRVRDLDAVS